MSLRDKILKKGVPGIKGIKPVHPAERKCTKTVTKLGRPRYICPPSGGKEAVRSLENLPVKPEDVPRKLQEISTLAPEQKFTPKQQREEPEKIKEALFRAPKTLHLKETTEAGPDKVQDNLHFKEPEEAGPDKVHDHLHLKEPKEAGPKKGTKDSKKKSDKEEDVEKALFLDSSVYFRDLSPAATSLHKALYVKDSKGDLRGPSIGKPTQSRKEQRASEEQVRKDVARQKFLVGEKTAPEDMSDFGKFLSENSDALLNIALMVPGGSAASSTGKLASGSASALTSLAKKHGLKLVEVAAGAARTPLMVAMLSLPGPAARNVVTGAAAAPKAKYALVASSKEIAEKAAKEIAPQAKTLVTAAKETAKSPATKIAAKTAATKTAETATKEAAKRSTATTAATAATAAATAKPAPAPTKAEAPAPTKTTTSAPKPGGAGPARPARPARRLPPPPDTSEGRKAPEKKKRRGKPFPKRAVAVRKPESRKQRLQEALSTAEEKHRAAKTRRGAYSKVGRQKELSEIQEKHSAAYGAEKQKRQSDLFSSLSASFGENRFEKSAAFVAPYARQVLNKKMSLTAALDKVPWYMQDDLLQYLRDKKKKR